MTIRIVMMLRLIPIPIINDEMSIVLVSFPNIIKKCLIYLLGVYFLKLLAQLIDFTLLWLLLV